MPSGYDKRERVSSRYLSETWNAYSGLKEQVYRGYEKKESVISFRDNTSGTRLDPKSVDLYSGFFQRNSAFADYLNPGPRLLAELEASGLAENGDYQTPANFLDNGHPFSLERREVSTSLRTRRDYRVYGFPANEPRPSGYPFVVNQMVVSSSGVSKLPWTLPTGNDSSTRVWRLDQPIPSADQSRLQSDGTRMISLVAPGQPSVDLVATVGELFAGVPLLPGSDFITKGLIPNFGSEYLNLVFGIIPTYGDAVKVAEAMKTVSTRLLQLKKHAGKPLRRKMAFPIEQRAAILNGNDLLGGPNIHCYVAGGADYGFNTVREFGYSGSSAQRVHTWDAVPTLFIREARKVWFSGSFTYFIPTIPGLSGKLEKYLAMYDQLLGLSANSANAWQLSPWSWLIDWFLDIRQNIDAISIGHSDNLVVNYGYAMEQIDRSIVAKLQFTQGSGIAGNPYVNTYQKLTSKRRIRANPYGFVSEQDSSQWSTYRLAVLSALGISLAR